MVKNFSPNRETLLLNAFIDPCFFDNLEKKNFDRLIYANVIDYTNL
jgi:hypothetical protein